MTKASNARAARRTPRARIETNGNGNGKTNGNTEGWNKVKSLAEIGRLGAEKGAGIVSLASAARHLVKMADLNILSSAGDDAKHHHKEYNEKKNGSAVGERAGDATKVGQFKNFLKLGELGGKVNGEGLLARVSAKLEAARKLKIPLGQPRPKDTFVAFLEVAKKQLEVGNTRELTNDEITAQIMTKAAEVKSQRQLVADAIAEITAAVKMGGAPKSLAQLAANIQALLPKLSNAKPE